MEQGWRKKLLKQRKSAQKQYTKASCTLISVKVVDPTQLLRYSKRECFEAANILVILENENHVTHELKEHIFNRLHILCKRIQAYSDSLT